MNKCNIGFVGLGRMGSGMARNLVKAGFPLVAYDVRESTRRALVDLDKIVDALEEVFSFCDILITSLPGSPEVEGVVSQFIESGVHNKAAIDVSTSFPDSTRTLYRKMKAAAGGFLDAPLAGGPPRAAQGTLTVMVGGDEAVYETHLPILQAIGSTVFYVGPSGSGNTVKLAANYLSILYVVLYAEILPVLEKLGVEPARFFDVVSAGGANSPMFQLFAPKIIHDDYEISFCMDLAMKDLDYLKRLADQIAAPCGMLDAAMNWFKLAKGQGLDKRDISELALVMKESLGIDRRATHG